MIVDRLVLHHTYEGSTAFDVSMHHHHGVLEDVYTHSGLARFSESDSCVRVAPTGELATLRAVRTTVQFLWHPTGGARRHNLIEGYLSFALVIEDDAALGGGILDRTGTWRGARSDPGLVTPGEWHTATFVHDGISSCRLDFNGVTVAEAFDVPGPAQGVQQPYGLAIGHWPDPDDRYTFEGDIDDVRVWVDRLDDGRELADPCCCHHRDEADRAFEELRTGRFDAAAYRQSASDLYDVGSRVFGQLAAGTQADRDHAHHLARRFALGLSNRDAQSLGTTIGDAMQLMQSRMSTAEIDTAAFALQDAIHGTPLEPLVRQALQGGSAATAEGLQPLIQELGLDRWMRGFCVDWVVPAPPPRGRKKPERHPDHATDPATDHEPDDAPPSWGADGPHDDGNDDGAHPVPPEEPR